jgi:hypothetical protein
MNNAQVSGGGSFDAPVQVNGFTNDGNSLSASGSAHIELPTFIVPPPIGVAVDSAWVAFSAQAQQPVLTLALAVFGNCAALLRVAYTVHVVIGHGGDHGGGGSTTVSTTLKHT